MSFSLYYLNIITKDYPDDEYQTNNETSIHLAGDKIVAYTRGREKYSVYDLRFNLIRDIKGTSDFARIYNLSIHRYGAIPEVYSGYGDGVNPRCPIEEPYVTCMSELDRYIIGSNDPDLICPGASCDAGNVSLVYYDTVKNKLLASTSCSGRRVYIIDPATKEVKHILARIPEGFSDLHLTHWGCTLLPYDNNYIYILVTPYETIGVPDIGFSSLYRIKIDDLVDLDHNSIIEDHAEKIRDITEHRVYEERTSFTDTYRGGWIVHRHDPGSPRFVTTLKPDGSLITHYIEPDLMRYHGTRYGIRIDGYNLYVIDLVTLDMVQSFTLGFLSGWWNYQNDPIYLVLNDVQYLYIHLLKYKGVVPVIQYDHENRRFRVVDYITGNPVDSEVTVYRSRLCTPGNMPPLHAYTTKIRVSDWTNIPVRSKYECANIVISEVYG